MISFEEFKKLYSVIPGEPEFTVCFKRIEDEYMIIKYEDCVSLQRCGYPNGSEEFYYSTLEELYNTASVDGICFKMKWDDIDTIVLDAMFDLSDGYDVEELSKNYETKEKELMARLEMLSKEPLRARKPETKEELERLKKAGWI